MISEELVTAVLCAPITAKDMQLTEREKNVIIIRKLEYETDINYIKNRLARGFDNSSIRLMFIFNHLDAIVMRSIDDLYEVKKRLQLY